MCAPGLIRVIEETISKALLSDGVAVEANEGIGLVHQVLVVEEPGQVVLGEARRVRYHLFN